MLVPEAAVKVQLDRTAAFTPPCLSPAHTHTPSKRHWGTKHNILAKRVGFIHPNQATQSQSHRHRLHQDEDEYEHEDDEYDEDDVVDRTQQKQLLRGPAAKMGFLFFFKSSCKALEKLFTLRDF